MLPISRDEIEFQVFWGNSLGEILWGTLMIESWWILIMKISSG